MSAIPSRLNEIIEEFQFGEGRERLELLLYYSEKLPPFPERLKEYKNGDHQVHECMTPVFIYAETKDGHIKFYFDIPPQSPTVRGYASILLEGLDGATADQILQVPDDFYVQMKLQEVLSIQRLNGIAAILAHMKRLVLDTMSDN